MAAAKPSRQKSFGAEHAGRGSASQFDLKGVLATLDVANLDLCTNACNSVVSVMAKDGRNTLEHAPDIVSHVLKVLGDLIAAQRELYNEAANNARSMVDSELDDGKRGKRIPGGMRSKSGAGSVAESSSTPRVQLQRHLLTHQRTLVILHASVNPTIEQAKAAALNSVAAIAGIEEGRKLLRGSNVSTLVHECLVSPTPAVQAAAVDALTACALNASLRVAISTNKSILTLHILLLVSLEEQHAAQKAQAQVQAQAAQGFQDAEPVAAVDLESVTSWQTKLLMAFARCLNDYASARLFREYGGVSLLLRLCSSQAKAVQQGAEGMYMPMLQTTLAALAQCSYDAPSRKVILEHRGMELMAELLKSGVATAQDVVPIRSGHVSVSVSCIISCLTCTADVVQSLLGLNILEYIIALLYAENPTARSHAASIIANIAVHAEARKALRAVMSARGREIPILTPLASMLVYQTPAPLGTNALVHLKGAAASPGAPAAGKKADLTSPKAGQTSGYALSPREDRTDSTASGPVVSRSTRQKGDGDKDKGASAGSEQALAHGGACAARALAALAQDAQFRAEMAAWRPESAPEGAGATAHPLLLRLAFAVDRSGASSAASPGSESLQPDDKRGSFTSLTEDDDAHALVVVPQYESLPEMQAAAATALGAFYCARGDTERWTASLLSPEVCTALANALQSKQSLVLEAVLTTLADCLSYRTGAELLSPSTHTLEPVDSPGEKPSGSEKGVAEKEKPTASRLREDKTDKTAARAVAPVEVAKTEVSHLIHVLVALVAGGRPKPLTGAVLEPRSATTRGHGEKAQTTPRHTDVGKDRDQRMATGISKEKMRGEKDGGRSREQHRDRGDVSERATQDETSSADPITPRIRAAACLALSHLAASARARSLMYSLGVLPPLVSLIIPADAQNKPDGVAISELHYNAGLQLEVRRNAMMLLAALVVDVELALTLTRHLSLISRLEHLATLPNDHMSAYASLALSRLLDADLSCKFWHSGRIGPAESVIASAPPAPLSIVAGEASHHPAPGATESKVPVGLRHATYLPSSYMAQYQPHPLAASAEQAPLLTSPTSQPKSPGRAMRVPSGIASSAPSSSKEGPRSPHVVPATDVVQNKAAGGGPVLGPYAQAKSDSDVSVVMDGEAISCDVSELPPRRVFFDAGPRSLKKAHFRPLYELATTPVSKRHNATIVVADPWPAYDLKLCELIAKARALLKAAAPAARQTVEALAQLVSEAMAGPIPFDDYPAFDCETELMKLRVASGTNAIPIGEMKRGSGAHRAMLFKVLADCIGLRASLVRSSFAYRPHAYNEVDVLDADGTLQPVVVDLLHSVGEMYPALSEKAVLYKRE